MSYVETVVHVAGSIDKISIEIPWKSLKTQPPVVSVEGLTVVVGPISAERYSADLEAALIDHDYHATASEQSTKSDDSHADKVQLMFSSFCLLVDIQ